MAALRLKSASSAPACRHAACCDALAALKPGIVCLQVRTSCFRYPHTNFSVWKRCTGTGVAARSARAGCGMTDGRVTTAQEFDFGTPGFAELYEQRLGGEFEIHTKRRTGSKDDGLALLVRRAGFDEVSVHELELEPRSCDRVALLVRLRHRWP